jgi:hypothetical protein
MKLHFALGKAYGDLGERERSFGHLLAGNREKRLQTPYDEAATLQRFTRIARACTPQLLAARRGAGHMGEAPVFVVGMLRSGSSLVEQILASHPQVHGAGECEAFGRAIAELRLPQEQQPPEAMAELPAEALRRLGESCEARLRHRAPQALRVVDKTLVNFTRLGLIHLALPQAKIIHTVRDPVDTCLSCFSHLFDGDHPYAYDLAELGRYWRAYEALMAHWRALLPPGVLLDLRYEDLVDDLEGQARRLVQHCGLQWHPACLDFHTTQRSVRTASLAQVREPIFRSSLHKGRAYGSLLQPLLEALQIPAAAGLDPPAATV